jgi:hypothetical protein
MPLFWLALAVATVSVVASAIYLTLKGLEAFRAFKGLGRSVTSGLERIERATGEIERHLALAGESGARLESELAQLRRSRASLNVLRSAIADVRASVGRITSVYPRK